MGSACRRHCGARHVRRRARAELSAVHALDAAARHVAGADRAFRRDDAGWPDSLGVVRAGCRTALRSAQSRRRLFAGRRGVLPGHRLSAGLGRVVHPPLPRRRGHQPALCAWRGVGAVAGATVAPGQGDGGVQCSDGRRLRGGAIDPDHRRRIWMASFHRRDCRFCALRADPARRVVEADRFRGGRPGLRRPCRIRQAGAGAAAGGAGLGGGAAKHLCAYPCLRYRLRLTRSEAGGAGDGAVRRQHTAADPAWADGRTLRRPGDDRFLRVGDGGLRAVAAGADHHTAGLAGVGGDGCGRLRRLHNGAGRAWQPLQGNSTCRRQCRLRADVGRRRHCRTARRGRADAGDRPARPAGGDRRARCGVDCFRALQIG